jgi:hypothetical protein
VAHCPGHGGQGAQARGCVTATHEKEQLSHWQQGFPIGRRIVMAALLSPPLMQVSVFSFQKSGLSADETSWRRCSARCQSSNIFFTQKSDLRSSCNGGVSSSCSGQMRQARGYVTATREKEQLTHWQQGFPIGRRNFMAALLSPPLMQVSFSPFRKVVSPPINLMATLLSSPSMQVAFSLLRIASR